MIIKTIEGETLEDGVFFPVQVENWSPANKAAVVPLYLVFAIGWGLEMYVSSKFNLDIDALTLVPFSTTHLEELCFWMFLINAKTQPDSWFQTIYFKVWAVGSFTAMTLFIVVTIVFRNNPLQVSIPSYLCNKHGI